MTTEEALMWADTFGPIQTEPPNGDGPALVAALTQFKEWADEDFKELMRISKP